MTKSCKPTALLLLAGLLVWGSAACSSSEDSASNGNLANRPVASPDQAAPASAQTGSQSGSMSKAVSKAEAGQTKSSVEPFQRALERAASASTMSQSAQSRDDWRLVANRWQQAIQLMQAIPSTNPRQSQVAQKLTEYKRNLIYAQRQASRSTAPANPDGVIVLSPGLLPQKSSRPVPAPVPVAAAPQNLPAVQPAPPSSSPQAAKPSKRTFSVPIVRRAGNTPVVRVMFNASQSFDMIVDTGASGTLITRQMANALNVVPVAEATVDTASQKDVTFPLGYVQSVELGGVVANNLLVAVAENQLDIGLLGHDFFGNYDVTIRQNSVEFRER